MTRPVLELGAPAAALVAILALCAPLAAQETARQILDGVQQLNETERAWSDRGQKLLLTIVDRRGGERQRELEMWTKKQGERASRSLLFFRAPAQVRGIGFLQWIVPGEADQQWLYLPALKRTRKISGAGKQESFVGTDFSYEDLSIIVDVLDWTEEDARSVLLRDEEIDGQRCAVIELELSDADSAYRRIRLWLGRDDHIVHKFEFDDRGGRLYKTLLLDDIRPVGVIPVAHRMEMRNERSGSRTHVVLEEVRYDTGIGEDAFTQRRLEKGL